MTEKAIPYRPAGEFGNSNEDAHILSVEQYRDAAVADGWKISPTYGNEPVTSAAKLRRDGFVMSVLARRRTGGRYKYEAGIHIWGPDGLGVEPPPIYSFAAIVAGTRRCSACGKGDVETTRFSFAGRCCRDCLPEMRRQHEQPGWCD